LHSRSGKPKGSAPGYRGRNPDYPAAFRAIFDRLNVETVAIERVLLDSNPARLKPEEERTLAIRDDFETGEVQEVANAILSRMRAFGRSQDMPPNEGNQNKRMRIDTNIGEGEIVRRLGLVRLTDPKTAAQPGRLERRVSRSAVDALREAELRTVLPEHVVIALERLDAGDPAADFDASSDYDVVTTAGRKYAPKKVFGLAIEEALGIKAQSGPFNVGWGTPCFDILEQSGLWIVPKRPDTKRPRPDRATLAAAIRDFIPTDEERSWIEGNPRIATHMIRERQPGLASRKRGRFIEENGKLVCERCEMDPEATYGEEAGAACIEVHHHRTHVANMEPGHATSLDDLRCLCANCHRVLHRAISLGVSFDI
jgi:5-methylcytosine-specific restriction protein A